MQQPRINSRYQIESLLGQGGMGVVYKAFDTQRQGYVALKTMKDAADSTALPLFAQEWKTLANISHPNIVDVLDSGEFEEGGQRKPFFVMPLLPGRTLDTLIREGSRLAVERIVDILVQACRGLQAAHGGGLIHRDLKPSNLFVMNDDSVKIIDFGMVHLSDFAKSVTGIKGTLQYMSPEQLEMKELTPATDIFSLGVVAYEALTGRKPFDRGSAAATAQAIRTEFPPSASALNPVVNKTVAQVVAKAMAKGPWNRYASAREFGDYLQKALRGEAIDEFDPSRIQPRVERVRKALDEGDLEYANEILNELQSEGHAESTITLLVDQVNAATRGKSVRLLLDSARMRLREQEFPLAWQKVQEALYKDPTNQEALALQAEIESRRSDQQIDKWRRLVHQHLHNQAFSQARHAIEEIRKLTSDSVEASELIAEVDRRELAFQQTCEDREQQFQSAMRAYGVGEISSALSKLEKLLEADTRAPGSVSAQRAEAYQQTYNKIRSEWEAVRHAIGEIERLISVGDLSRATELCARESEQRSNDIALQALKLKIEDLLRHEKSAYIAEIGQRVDAEPDLDKGVRCLEEALQRYPNERTFEEALEVVRRRRDFVNSIVAKARHYEDQNLVVEALGQWDTLRSIHPRYPGLDLEIERVRNRRDQRRREDTKLNWVGRIDQLVQAGDNDAAADLAVQALADFPGDNELEDLKRVALEGRGRSTEATALVERARALCSNHQFSEGVVLLRKAAELDPNNTVVRTNLADALTEQARGLISIEWRAAEPLIQEALRICPTHEAARTLRPSLLLARRNEFIDESIASARKLHGAGDIPGALRKVEQGLEAYPNDSRLIQLQNGLRGVLAEKERLRRSRDLDEVTQISREVADETNKTALTALLERSVAIAKEYPGDGDFLSAIAAVREKAKADADKAESEQADTEAGAIHEQPVEAASQGTAAATARAREVAKPSQAVPAPQRAKPARRRLSRKQQVALAALPLVAMFLVMFTVVKTNSGHEERLRTLEHPITFKTNLTGAAILVDGNPVNDNTAKLTPGNHSLAASFLGYKPIQKDFTVGNEGSTVEVILDPEPHAIRISADMPGAKVLMDGAEIGAIQEGSFSYDLPAGGTHNLQLRDARGEVFAVNFAAEAGKPAHLAAPLSARDQAILVVANLGPRAFAHSSLRQMQATAPDGQLQPIPPEGREFTLATAKSELTFNDGTQAVTFPLEAANAPVLSIRVGNPTKGTLLVEANVDGATVFINGQKTARAVQSGKWRAQLGPGDHKVRLAMAGYNDSPEQTVTVTAGKITPPAKFELTPVVTSAFLRIDGGTPEAEVSVDGRPIGRLDSSGSLAPTAVGPDADHTIRLQKADHEDVQLRKRAPVKETIAISGNEARLRPFGTIVFEIQPAEAEITLQHQGESPRGVSGRTIKVRQGAYTVRATANGHLPFEGPVQVAAGQPVTVRQALPRRTEPEPPKPVTPTVTEIREYFDPSPKWKRSADGTWAHEGPLWLKDMRFRRVFEVQKIDRLVGKEKLKWVIFIAKDHSWEFEFDGSTFKKREIKGNKSVDSKEQKTTTGNTYRLQIEITPDRIIQKVGPIDDTIEARVQGRTGFYGKVAVKSIQ